MEKEAATKKAQDFFNKNGFTDKEGIQLQPDGKRGPKTEQAYRAYKKYMGYKEPESNAGNQKLSFKRDPDNPSNIIPIEDDWYPADDYKPTTLENRSDNSKGNSDKFKFANNTQQYISINPKALSGQLKKGMGTNDLNTGDSKYVEILQKKLIDLGYMESITQYGYFGDATEKAVNNYKDDKGLGNQGAYKGVVGQQTWKYLGLHVKDSTDEKNRCENVCKKIWKVFKNQYWQEFALKSREKNLSEILYNLRQDMINIGNKTKVPPELIFSIITKEQLTKSLSDDVLYYSDKTIWERDHSYGLGAIFADTAISAWESAGKKEEFEERYNKDNNIFSFATTQKDMIEYALKNDDVLNIYTIAYILKNISSSCGYGQNLNKLSYEQLKNVLSYYNSGAAATSGSKGEKYGRFTLEYYQYAKEYLYG